jgi:hypothetical protein
VVQLVVNQLSQDKLVLAQDSTGIEVVWDADWGAVTRWIEELAELNAGGVHYVFPKPTPDPIPLERPSIALTTAQLARFAFAAGYFYRSWVA